MTGGAALWKGVYYAEQSHRTHQRGDPAGAGRPHPHRERPPGVRYAKIYVSVLDKSDVKEVVKGLKSAGGYLRRELGRALSLRYTPELQFVEDDSIDTGAHILSMLCNPEVVKPANPANAHIELDGEE